MPGCAEKLSQSAKGQDNGLGVLFAVTEELCTFDQVASPLCAKWRKSVSCQLVSTTSLTAPNLLFIGES